MSKYGVFKEERDESMTRIHVVPMFGPEHLLSNDCWCEPELDYKDDNNGGEVWSHRQVN